MTNLNCDNRNFPVVQQSALQRAVEDSKGAVIKVGNRSMISDAKFRAELLLHELYRLFKRNRKKWMTVGEAAKFCFASNNPHNRQKIRRRLRLLRECAISVGGVLIAEHDHTTGKVESIKLVDPDNFVDVETANRYAKQLYNQNELVGKRYHECQAILRAWTHS